MGKQTFALFFGNRGFFPESLIAGARKELQGTLAEMGYATLTLGDDATRYGAVETAEEGLKYAAFLAEHRGEYDGVILSLPNFGDENGAVAALKDCGVPVLIQAYPDQIGRMDFEHRRDSFCGKFSIMDVFYQHGLAFTAFKPHTVHPLSGAFRRQVNLFAAVCRVVGGMRRFTIGAIGARTTAFKTVRFDELALQKYGITVETLDLSELFSRVGRIDGSAAAFKAKSERLRGYTDWAGVPDEKFAMLAKAGVVIDEIIAEYRLDCLALRCWIEMERELGVSPCVLLSELNERGITAACELDVCTAIAMRALGLAAQGPSACLDWNNNYGDAEDKCILFHCGPVPQSVMAARGRVIEHAMFAKSLGPGCGWGCNVGRIARSPLTFSSAKTENGKLLLYLGEGSFTDDEIEEGFFGCGGVAEIEGLQDKLLAIGKKGFRHHVGVAFGHVAIPLAEAFETYLGYETVKI